MNFFIQQNTTMNKKEELKARLRNHAIEVEDFSGGYNEQRKSIKKAKFIRLDMALLAIDELVKSKPDKKVISDKIREILRPGTDKGSTQAVIDTNDINKCAEAIILML